MVGPYKQEMTDLPILYTFRRCPFAMRARMALYEASQPARVREVVLRQKPPAMLEASPKGTVPVMVLPGGAILQESFDIMLWAFAQSDPEARLGATEGEQAQMIALIEQIDGVGENNEAQPGSFKYHLDRYKYSNRYEEADPLVERKASEAHLAQLEERLCQTPFLFGDRVKLADLAIAPFIRQFANTDREWFDAAPYPKLQAWLTAMLTRDAFVDVMTKYEPWQQGDDPPLRL
jgi:glutathione S-transferase